MISEPNNAYCEIVDIVKETKISKKCSMYGYRRQNLRSGSYYYQMYLNGDYIQNLNIDKMIINGLIDNIPNLITIKKDDSVKVKGYEGMISCDFTGDKTYILCTYFSSELNVGISVYNNYLDFITTKYFEKIDDYIDGDNFIKIVYFKDNTDFILMNSQDHNIIRFRYFSYKNREIIDKLSPIINNKNTYLDISNIQNHHHNGDNEIIVFNSEKIIKLGSNGANKNIIITIFQFYNNYSVMSIKIYDMFNNNGFTAFWQSRMN